MIKLKKFLPLLCLSIAACDGPRENAGEKADVAAGKVGSEDTMRQGPAERLGEKADEAIERRSEALEARASSVEAAADKASEAAKQ